MNVINILGMDFAQNDASQRESYTIFENDQKVARCHADRGAMIVLDDQGSLVLEQAILGNNHLDDRERLFCLMHAARAVKDMLSKTVLSWDKPLRFRETLSDSAKIIQVIPMTMGDGVYVMVEYPHPMNQSPITDIWAYEKTTGRPLNPELRMNPMRRYDIINSDQS